MKNLKIKLKFHHFLFPFLSLFLFFSCTPEDTLKVEEDAVVLTDTWICDIKSSIEKGSFYQLYMDENHDYLAASDSKILKVSKDGFLLSNHSMSFSAEENDRIKIHNSKVYRFYQTKDLENYDPTEKIKLQIFDSNGDLISDNELDSNGLFYDGEFESDNILGILVYYPDERSYALKKLHITDGLISEKEFSRSVPLPTDLHITESGKYFLTGSFTSSNSANFIFLNNDLNPIWSKKFMEFPIMSAKHIPDVGFCLAGISDVSDSSLTHKIALTDRAGGILKSFEYEAEGNWPMHIQISDDKVYLIDTRPESGKNLRVLVFDFDLNLESTIEIPGNVIPSNIAINEHGSFSFLYGIATEPDPIFVLPEFNPRIFKFDNTYTLPTNVIIQ